MSKNDLGVVTRLIMLVISLMQTNIGVQQLFEAF